MAKYSESNEIKKMRDLIGYKFFEHGRDMTPKDMLYFKETRNTLEILFNKEGVNSEKHKMMYLNNLKRSYKNKLPKKDPRVQAENSITIKKVRKHRREVKKIKTKNIIKAIEYNDEIETKTQSEYHRISEVKFNSQISQLTQEMLLDLIKRAKEEVEEVFSKSGKLVLSKQEQEFRNKIEESGKEILELEKQISQTGNFFKEQIQQIALNKEASDDIYKAKMSYEMLCKSLELKLKTHRQIIIDNQNAFQDWKEKRKKYNEGIIDVLLKYQHIHAGAIANDKSLVEANYIKRDVSDSAVNDIISDEALEKLKDALNIVPATLENEQQYKMLDEVNFNQDE